MEQIRGRLTNITATGDQDSRHVVVVTSLRRGVLCALHPARRRGAVATTDRIIASALRGCCDFNFFKHVFLESADLFETNELQEREKRYDDFHARYGSPKQVGKT